MLLLAATLHAAGVSDLPLVEIPSAGAKTLAIMISGDGGWAKIDRDIAGELTKNHVAVVGLNSLRYFWDGRDPATAARDLSRIADHYLAGWHCERIVLIGYSRGADVLPFMTSRLASSVLARVDLVALVAPSPTVEFQFHVADWFIDSNKGMPTKPEVQKLRGRNLLCVHGRDETDSLCTALDAGLAKSVALPGTHHFDGDYGAIARTILREMKQ